MQFFIKCTIPGTLRIIRFIGPQLFEHKKTKNFIFFSQPIFMNNKSIRMYEGLWCTYLTNKTAGCVPPACRPYLMVVSQVLVPGGEYSPPPPPPRSHVWGEQVPTPPILGHTHPLPLDIPTPYPWTYPPLEIRWAFRVLTGIIRLEVSRGGGGTGNCLASWIESLNFMRSLSL